MTYPDKPLAGPGAWYGAELADSDRWIREFTESEIRELEAAVKAARESGKPRTALTREDISLPTLATEIRRWVRELAEGQFMGSEPFLAASSRQRTS